MIIINDNDYSNPYDECNDNKAKLKESITKIIKVLLACAVIKRLIIEIIKLLIITIITVIMIINNSHLYDTMKINLKVRNGEMRYGMCEKNLIKTKMFKSQEYSNCHEPLSQEWVNVRYRT